MTESKYKSDIEYNVYRLTGSLIKAVCDISESSVNYKRAEEFVQSNLQFHTYLNPLYVDVSTTYSNIIEKLRVNSQTRKAQRLEELYKKFMNMKLQNPKGITDLNIRLLDLFLKLSIAPLDSDYMPPKLFERKERFESAIIEESDKDRLEEYSDSEKDSEEDISHESLSGDSDEEFKIPQPVPINKTKKITEELIKTEKSEYLFII